MKLRGVGKGKLCRLSGHRLAHRGDAVTDVDYSRLPGGVKVLVSVCGVDPTALATDCLRIVLGKTSRKERRMIGHGRPRNGQILADCGPRYLLPNRKCHPEPKGEGSAPPTFRKKAGRA